MFKKYFTEVKSYIKTLFSPRKWLNSAPTAVISLGKNHDISGKVLIGENSKIIIGDDVKITSAFIVGANCDVHIGKHTRINNASFDIQDGAQVSINDGVIFDPPQAISVRVWNGTLNIDERAHIQSNILVRFGGRLQIGKYTGIGYHSEIRCEELVQIGSYGLFSYNLHIFDTNTHSTDWRERRRRIEEGYPIGSHESAKPATAPVKIGNDVWIGDGATILKGVSIGDRCIVGIKTVVPNGIYENDSIIVTGKPRVVRKSMLQEDI